MLRSRVLLLGILFQLCGGQKDPKSAVTVKLSTGVIEGRRQVFNDSINGTLFLGIPYAEVPEGALRFANAKPKLPWSDTALPCFEYKAACWQNRSRTSVQDWISEDCLYVNVFKGDNCTSESPCAVVVYAHGGGFDYDSPRMFSPDYIGENFLSRGVIFVTVGYRLGVLGFFSTSTPEALGNYGLSDIIEALRWVKREIPSFGGDPSKVTLMGHSSGASVVSLLTLSPQTANLIQQAIVMSGSALAPDAVSNDDRPYKMLAFRLGCSPSITSFGKNILATIECLKRIEIARLDYEYSNIERELNLHTSARIDGVGGILPRSLGKMMASRRSMPYMIGTTAREFIATGNEPAASRQTATPLTLLMACKVGFLTWKLREGKIKPNIKECFVQYAMRALLNANATTGALDWDSAVEQVKNDYGIFLPIFMDAAFMRATGAPVYLYSFDYVGSKSEPNAPSHAMDLTYLLGVHMFPLDDADKRVQQNWLNLLTNFMKHANPTPDAVASVIWTPLQYPRGFNYLSIGDKLQMKALYHISAMMFMNSHQDGKEEAHSKNKQSVHFAGMSPLEVQGMLMSLYESVNSMRENSPMPEAWDAVFPRKRFPEWWKPEDEKASATLYWTCISILILLLILSMSLLICCGRTKYKQRKAHTTYQRFSGPDDKCASQSMPMYQTF